ncbi:MAG TPA: condensation domain-containing protein, partial [Vicinamibacteria bacterium]
EEGRLKTRSPSAAIDPAVAGQIREHKESLIAFLSDAAGAAAEGTASIPLLSDRARGAELSFAQQRLWFIDQLEQGSTQYNVAMALRLSGELDEDALQRALDAIVLRHEVLRTVYRPEHGRPLQHVVESRGVPIARVDLGGDDPARRARRLEELANAEAHRPFDLSGDLLLRCVLVRLGPREHMALFTTHHLASDGWSKGILVREFGALYTAFCQGAPDPLPALPVQYRDYAAWQRQILHGDRLRQQLDWWKARLAGSPPVHSLPLSRRRPAQQRFEGGKHEAVIPARAVVHLKALCSACDVTPFVLLQTVLATLVARYSNAGDVVLGTPVSGRVHQDIEPLVGFFVNTLALRTEVRPEQPFRELLLESKRLVLDAFHRQDVPFEMLVEELRPERSLSYSPLFQILFSYHHGDGGRLRLPGLVVETPSLSENTNQFDLECNVLADADAEAARGDAVLRLAWSYNRTLFDPAFIAALSDSFSALLDGVLADPDRPVGRLPLLDAARHRTMVEEWNQTAAAHARDELVHQRFERQAARTPDRPALAFEGREVDYGTLNQQANRLAHCLIERGVRPGVRVGVCIRRSPEMVLGLLAVLKAGGAYVPIDPGAPADRIRFTLADAQAGIVLTEQDLWHELPFEDCEVLPLDAAAVAAMLQVYPVQDPDPGALGLTSDHLAYVIYTSGSTGRPKGVMVPHRGVVNYLEHVAGHYLDEGVAGAVVSTPLAFDATVTTVMGAWSAGKPTLLLADDNQDSLAQLASLLRSGARQLFKLTPAHLDALAAGTPPAPCPPEHVVVVGGEQLTARTLERFRRRVVPRAQVVNEYGPTETVVGCSTYVTRGLNDGDGVG